MSTLSLGSDEIKPSRLIPCSRALPSGQYSVSVSRDIGNGAITARAPRSAPSSSSQRVMPFISLLQPPNPNPATSKPTSHRWAAVTVCRASPPISAILVSFIIILPSETESDRAVRRRHPPYLFPTAVYAEPRTVDTMCRRADIYPPLGIIRRSIYARYTPDILRIYARCCVKRCSAGGKKRKNL